MAKRGRPLEHVTRARRVRVLELWRSRVMIKDIAEILKDEFDSPTTKTIGKDIALFKKDIVAKAVDLLGNEKQALADFVEKSLDLRDRCVEDGKSQALTLAHQIDKDLLKIIGINLDRIEVSMMTPDEVDSRILTFHEVIGLIRDQKALPPVPNDGF